MQAQHRAAGEQVVQVGRPLSAGRDRHRRGIVDQDLVHQGPHSFHESVPDPAAPEDADGGLVQRLDPVQDSRACPPGPDVPVGGQQPALNGQQQGQGVRGNLLRTVGGLINNGYAAAGRGIQVDRCPARRHPGR